MGGGLAWADQQTTPPAWAGLMEPGAMARNQRGGPESPRLVRRTGRGIPHPWWDGQGPLGRGPDRPSGALHNPGFSGQGVSGIALVRWSLRLRSLLNYWIQAGSAVPSTAVLPVKGWVLLSSLRGETVAEGFFSRLLGLCSKTRFRPHLQSQLQLPFQSKAEFSSAPSWF
jgi:hypothetical protein